MSDNAGEVAAGKSTAASLECGAKVTGWASEKNLVVGLQAPVPQTDTGRRGEDPKAREKTLVKELGKIAP